jgi:hypothetical protein
MLNMLRLILFLLMVSLVSSPGSLLWGQIGATPEECTGYYGKPERDAMKESGLLCFRKEPLCYIAHFYQGRCDMLSIFSSQDEMGVPEGLSDNQIAGLLRSEGSPDREIDWQPVSRAAINGIWKSPDGKSFAVYDTMRHKLVIMTRAAYKREKEAKLNGGVNY